MTDLDSAYYEDLQGRLRALLITVGDQLSKITVELISELVDANECGVALEMMSEMLVETGAAVEAGTVVAVADLAGLMGLGSATADRLKPLTGQ